MSSEIDFSQSAESDDAARFLADVNSRSRSLLAVAIPSVVCVSSVCDVGAPSGVVVRERGGTSFR